MTSLNSRANISARTVQHTHTTSGAGKSFQSGAPVRPDVPDLESNSPIQIHISHIPEPDLCASLSRTKTSFLNISSQWEARPEYGT